MKPIARRRLKNLQLLVLAGPMVLAAWLAQSSQGGGITPAVAFFCPLFGPFSFLFGPNSRAVDDLHPGVSALAVVLAALIPWSLTRSHAMQASKAQLLVAATGLLAMALWVFIGLVRVAYSMA